MARKRPFVAEDLYLFRNVVDPQISRDGKTVAYVVTWPDKEADEARMSVYVAPMDGKAPARRFTQGKKDHSPRWSPDGGSLAFVSERGDKNQVFVAPIEGGEARQVTKAKHGAGAPAWSPDGKRIAYVARTGNWKDPKDRTPIEKNAPRVIRDLRYKLDGIGFFDNRRTHIFTVDVESGEAKQVTSGDYYDDQPAWSPDGKRIAFVSDRERDRHQRQWRTDIWVTPLAGGKARRVTRAKGSASNPAFSPDGKLIAFVGHETGEEGGAKNIHLMVAPATGGAPRSVSAALDRPASGWPVFMYGRAFDWTANGKSLRFLAGDRGTVALYEAPADGRKATKVLDGERQIGAFAMAPDGKRIAFNAAWSDQPWEIYATTLNGGRKETNLSHANDEIREKLDMGRLERMTYQASDGLEIEAFVLYPPDYRRGRRYPLSVNVHGGPHSYHPGMGYFVEFQAVANAGFVQLLPNPRGSTTYGETFSGAVVRDWGGWDWEDIVAGVDELVERGVADPKRLYLGGYSYGGFMTSWGVGHTDRFAAALVGAPVSDQVSMFGTGDIPLFDIQEIGGTPQADFEEWWKRSPVGYLGNVTTPVLLVHWEGDLRCPIGQSEEIFHALKVQHKEVEFVRYPGGFHTGNTHAPSQTVDRIKRTIAWYERYAPRTPKKAKKAARRKVKMTARA